MTSTAFTHEADNSPTRSIREARQLHHARFGIDLNGPSAAASSTPDENSAVLNFDISREEDFLRRHREQAAEQSSESTETAPSSKKVLNFPVMIHHEAVDDVTLSSYHTVAGRQRRGLLVDPGAAAGLIGSETLRDLVDSCLKPSGLDKFITWKERSTSVTGISGKGDSTLAEVTFEFGLDEHHRASFSADVIGGEGSLCPALIGNPSLRAMKAVLLTQFFQNNDGLLVCHTDNSSSQPTMIRLLLTDSGHYIIPLDGTQHVRKEDQKKAVHFLGQVQQQAQERWSDCAGHLRYCFQTAVSSTPSDAELERSEEKTTPHALQPRTQEPRHDELYAPQPDDLPPPAAVLMPSPKHHHRDHWQKHDGHWVRHHVRSRQAFFSPQTSKFPDKLSSLEITRTSHILYDDGSTEEICDTWINDDAAQKMLLKKWTGMTVFEIKEDYSQKVETPKKQAVNDEHIEVSIADAEDHIFYEEELQHYEDDHFPEHISDHKRTYLKKFYKAVPEEFYSHLKRAPVTPQTVSPGLSELSTARGSSTCGKCALDRQGYLFWLCSLA